MVALAIASLFPILLLLKTVPIFDAASTPRSSSEVPRQLSPDCSTVIVNNSSRLPKSNDRRPPTVGCNPRQGRKLSSVVSNLFREEVENYPEDEIKLILQRTPKDLRDLYNVINTQLDPNTNLTERVASYPGYNDDENYAGEREESVCRTVTRNIYPREANLRNSLVYIPNNQDFMQVIQAEICHNPDAECNYLRDNLPYGMSSSCVQKYSYKKLLYMDPLDKRLSSDLFRYPSCCVCNVRTLSLDLRSNPNNQSGPMTGSTSTQLDLQATTSTNKLATMQTLGESSSSILDRGLSTNETNQAPPRQPIELVPKSGSSRSIERNSKQLRHLNNQTLILSDDKVYNPKN